MTDEAWGEEGPPLRTTDDEEGKEWEEQEARETPVPKYRCLWCKIPMDEWAEETESVEVETGEVLCSECIMDLRYYKRFLTVQIAAHDGFGPEVRRLMGKHFNNMAEDMEELFPDDKDAFLQPPRNSNAHGRSYEHGVSADPDDEDTDFTRGG
jgi:hypothetical protein